MILYLIFFKDLFIYYLMILFVIPVEMIEFWLTNWWVVKLRVILKQQSLWRKVN